MDSARDVVITGVGVISPIGIGVEPFWDALIHGRSGVSVREEFETVEHPFRIAAQVKDFEPKKYVRPRKALKVMCRPIQFGFAASILAIEQSKIVDNIQPDRFSTVFGTEAFYADPNEVARVFRKCIVNRCYDHDQWGQSAMNEIEPLWMLKYLPNMVASHISIACDARGPSNTICQSDASSPLAIIEAANLIRRGAADAVVAGGTGSLMATTGMIYRGLHRLSRRVKDPATASRPFDKSRDGMVVGEGACAIILERESHARARGANVLGRILGFCRSFHEPKQGFAQAITDSINTAIERSGVTADDIGHLNAQGFSTQQDDIWEAEGIAAALPDVPVIAPKSNFGNLGPGTGAVEIVASLESCRRGKLPAVINVDDQDPRCPINLVKSPHMSTNRNFGLSLNFSDTGQITSMVVAS